MKRVLIASTAVLTLALAFLVYRRLTAHAPPPAAEVATTTAAEPASGAPAAPAHEQAAAPAKDAHGQAAEPAKEEHTRPPEPASDPHAKAAEAPKDGPAEAAKAEPARPAPEPKQKQKGKRRAGADRAQPDEAASAAIFGDRPAGDGEPGKKSPRIPVLRKPSLGVAPPAYATAAATASSPGARPAAAGHATSPSAQRGPGSRPAPAPAVAVGPASSPARPAGPVQHLPGAVSGTLRSAAGARIAGTSVLAMAAGGDDALETITDDDGVYLLAGMKPGRYLLFAGLGSGGAPALPARAIEVQDGRVARIDLQEPSGGATVQVRPLRPDGRPALGQVVLAAGQLTGPATLTSLLASDGLHLPEPGGQNLFRHVPPGVYTPVLLQGTASEPRAARQPVTIRGDGDQVLEVRNFFQ